MSIWKYHAYRFSVEAFEIKETETSDYIQKPCDDRNINCCELPPISCVKSWWEFRFIARESTSRYWLWLSF